MSTTFRASSDLGSHRRISTTLPHHTYARLMAQSDREGRSLSNLAAFLLEQSIHQASQKAKAERR
jgi:hypothetical protein